MAVHLPLSAEAQAEARILMLSAHNILSPAHGRAIAVPSQDMIIGVYYLTELVDGAAGEGRAFASLEEAVMAFDTSSGTLQNDAPEGALSIHARIKVRMSGRRFPESDFPVRDDKNPDAIVLKRSTGRGEEVVLVETSLGRLLFTEAFPADFAFRVEGTQGLKKRAITEVIGDLVEEYPRAFVAESLDNLKDLGFRFATRSGLTIAISDVKTPPQKAAMLETFEAAAAKIEGNYDKGLLTDEERKQLERELWSDATDEVAQAMEAEMSTDRFNPIEMMVGSGARGNAVQVRQIAGMRGLVANPRGEIIPRPIKSNFREGLSVLEYFVSTHGARKGLADTALRTADSGYLTRRLVDVAQEVIVRDEDCGSTRGIMVENVLADGEAHRVLETSGRRRDFDRRNGLFPQHGNSGR